MCIVYRTSKLSWILAIYVLFVSVHLSYIVETFGRENSKHCNIIYTWSIRLAPFLFSGTSPLRLNIFLLITLQSYDCDFEWYLRLFTIISACGHSISINVFMTSFLVNVREMFYIHWGVINKFLNIIIFFKLKIIVTIP